MMSLKNNDDVKRCARCILPESLPSVHLDENGVCNHCRIFDSLMEDWNANKSRRKDELNSIVDQVKQADHKYDCLVTLSGGKDSTFALYLMAKIYKLKCLAVTFDNGFLSDHAKSNIRNAVESADADHVFYTINRNTLLKLYNLALRQSGQFCSVCMRGISLCNEFPPKCFDIPLKISGDGKRVSYLNSFPEVFESGSAYYLTKMVKGDPLEKESKAMLLAERSLWERGREKAIYIFNKILKTPVDKGPVQIQLYDHVEFSAEKILNTIQEEMGWTKPEGEFEHMDCLLHEMQHFVNIFKFKEITQHTFYRSYLIRLKEMTRDEALSLENEDLNNPREPEILESFLEEIKMSRAEFYSAVSNWKKIDGFRPGNRRITN
jgi:hypothetical protein